MKGILYKSKEGWMVKYTTYKTIPGIKGIMGSHSRMPESNYLPVHPDTKLYPDGLWGQANNSAYSSLIDFETVDFEIVEVITPVEDGTTMFKCAKLINEEKHTKRRQKKFTNIMEHNNVEKLCTNEDPNKLKEMSLNDAVEYLKQNPKESVKVTLSEDERNGINDFFKHYNLNNIYKKDGESEGGRW